MSAPLQNLLDRISTYRWWEVGIELILIWLAVYVVVRFVHGTRAAGVLKGALVLILVATLAARVISGSDAFQRLNFLFDRFLTVAAIGLVVVFQPELRRALIRLGEAPFLRGGPSDIVHAVEAITEACAYLSKASFGAIIVIERQVGLDALVETGTPIKGQVSARLLQTIFFPGTALHDLAVIVRGRVLRAAGVQLPLAEPGEMPDPSLGSRHRAAVGVTKESDALVVVVSEETRQIRIAQRGRLSRPLTPETLRAELRRSLQADPAPAPEDRRDAEEEAEDLAERTIVQDVEKERTAEDAQQSGAA